jgi:hypothetical protein
MLLKLLSRLRAWLFPKPKAASRRIQSLEVLESRIAPAMLVNAHIVTYTDVNGGHVTIDSSAPIFTKANVNQVLTFSTGSVDGTSAPQQLQEINFNLTTLAPKVIAGDNISVTVQKVGNSSDLANVGFIDSSLALGHVVVQGDLGAINAGDVGPKNVHYVGLTSLQVYSMGDQGLATQGGSGTLDSTIFGNAGSITVQQNVDGEAISVVSNSGVTATNGSLGSLRIGGSLIGESADGSGSITTDAGIGSIVIGGNIAGGSGAKSGYLDAGGKIGSLKVGSIIGYTQAGDMSGLGADSGSVVTGEFPSPGGIGKLIITGNLMGGDGENSGEVSEPATTADINGYFGVVKIGGTITGGSGDDSGELSGHAFGSISIGQGIVGGSGLDAGSIRSINGISSLTILSGGIQGGTDTDAGSVFAAIAPDSAALIGSLVIHGNVTGNSGAMSTVGGTAQINTGSSIHSITIDGSLTGSAGETSGSILAVESIGHVSVQGVTGGAGSNSGEISAFSLGSISVGGQIMGGSGPGSGKIIATGSISSVTVGNGIVGGSGDNSGYITTGSGFDDNLGSLVIKSGGITGGSESFSGSVAIGGKIGSVKIAGAITAGAGDSSGALTATDDIGSISLGSLASISGAGADSGEISAGGNLASLVITGAHAGSVNVDTGLVSVDGSAGSIVVDGSVTGSAASTGLFLISGGVKSFTINGALNGGAGQNSGAIFAGLDDAGVISSITVTGALFGGGNGSGEIFGGGGIAKASVGDLLGGGGVYSGSIVSDGALGAITVTGKAPQYTGPGGLIGGEGVDSAQISAGTTISSVTVNGSIGGGQGAGSGSIVSHSVFSASGDIQGNIGSVKITGDTGGVGAGEISAAGNINNLFIKGSVYSLIQAGTDLTGVSGGNINKLAIGGALIGPAVGQSVNYSGGVIEAAHIGSATLGSIEGGSGATNTTVAPYNAILASQDIASLTVTGAITGTYYDPVVISAVGKLDPGAGPNLAFGKISVGGDVTYASFLAGYDPSGNPVEGSASIGAVTIGGNWSGSNLVAGVIAGTDGHFGANNATLITTGSSIIPSIASIIIKGKVQSAVPPPPNVDSADTYGFVAGRIDAFTLDGVAQSLTLGVIDPVGDSTDTVLRDVTG